MRRARGTISVSIAATGILALLPHLLAPLDEPRKTFVALRYLATARRKLSGRPVDRAGAARDIKRAMALAPHDRIVLDAAGTILMLAEDYAAAAEVFTQRGAQGLDDVISLGHCLLMSTDPDRGEELVLSAVAQAEGLYRAGRRRRIGYALLLNNASYALVEGERSLVAAERMARMAVNMMPLEPAFCDTLGWAMFKNGNAHGAAFYIERAVRHQLPNPDAVVLSHLGQVYAKLDRCGQARRFLLWALAVDPGRSDAADALRRLYRILPPPAYASGPRRSAGVQAG